ncbi:hypothetical protein [Burkholderia sp. 8Y]|uniref:hypothetical protein n=1 Tax=Burkholderia sp. 8Y TaxID=2653133 RepID=UPI001F1B194D|nr:hypothetical protein [Burkholderia sp. 8Y]
MPHSSHFSFAGRTARACIACLLLALAACGTTSAVAPGSQPNVFTVTGKATGTRMSWVTARNRAMDAADDYCKERSQRVLVRSESTSGVRSLEEQTSTVTFTCVAQPTQAASE